MSKKTKTSVSAGMSAISRRRVAKTAFTPAEQELVRQAVSLIGQRTSERKAQTSRENGRRGGAPRRPLSNIPCICEHPLSLDAADHKAGCQRGKAIRRGLEGR